MAQRTKRRLAGSCLNSEEFLRSINIVLDADDSARIAHYFPTAKSTSLLHQLLGRGNDRSLLVVAPYGSGKSLVGAYALHAVENRAESRDVLKTLQSRLELVDPTLAEWQQDRIRKWSKRGLALTLHGYSDDLTRQLLKSAAESFRRLGEVKMAKPLLDLVKADSIDLLEALAVLKNSAEKAKVDQIVLLWDEFGRHLETLVAEGRAGELSDLQTLAEYASRQRVIPFTLSLFLHQGLLSYANSLPQTVRREWKKIEGRFATIDYVEDSKEIYRLIGEIVSSVGEGHAEQRSLFTKKATELLAASRFGGFSQSELADLLSNAFPLEPALIELLPRISARVSQNERTLFSFLFEVRPWVGDIGTDALYDYFSEQMQTDVEVGGTHRQWLETQSALSKVAGDATAESALKITCLLGLGLSGERAKATRRQLALALAGYFEISEAEEVITELIDRNLLLYRKHSDEVAVWHGTDSDLRGRLTEEKVNRDAGFDLVDFLTKEASPPVWKPQDYNDEFFVRRYFMTEFITVSQLEDQVGLLRSRITTPAIDEDGRILYVLSSSSDERRQAEVLIKSLYENELDSQDGSERVVFALPSEPLPIREAALEVACLLDMENDADLTMTDPLVLPEIQQMLDDARSHLHQLLDRLMIPSGRQTIWLYQGLPFHVESPRLLRKFLSSVLSNVYPLTPKFRNEVLVRKRPTPVIVNARKKLLLAMLNRCGDESFGIEGNFADASIFRTVIAQTGLYRLDDHTGRWGFVAPKAIDDPGLREVWRVIEDFFTAPSRGGKSPSDLFATLAAPPYGVRAGLFPVLFCAGFKAFAYTTSLARDGEYLGDVLPTDIELLCKEPERHRLKVLDLDVTQTRYLEAIRKLFSAQPQEGLEQDLVRNCHEAIQGWVQQLPRAALTSRRISKHSIGFRKLVTRESDPVALFLEELPRLFQAEPDRLLKEEFVSLKRAKAEIEGVIASYRDAACDVLRLALREPKKKQGSARESAKRWSASFLPILPPGHTAKPVLVRMQTEYDSDEKLLESIAGAISRVSLPRWEDDDVLEFSKTIKRLVEDVESDCIYQANLSDLRGTEAERPIADLLTERIDHYKRKLEELQGKAHAGTITKVSSQPSRGRKSEGKSLRHAHLDPSV